MTSMHLTVNHCGDRGLKLQCVCIIAMITLLSAYPYMHANVLGLLKQYDELDRQFWSHFKIKPVETASNVSVTMTTSEGNVAIGSSGYRSKELNAISSKQMAIVARAEFWGKSIIICQIACALLYFPLTVSVYQSTRSSHLAPRLSSLVMIPVTVLFAMNSLNSDPQNLAQYKPLLVILYSYGVFSIISLVFLFRRIRGILIPLGMLGTIPFVIAYVVRMQSESSSTSMIRFGIAGVSTIAVIACTVPYVYLCFQKTTSQEVGVIVASGEVLE